ncbi:MAG: RNA methyltransferase [Promethearchaeota archaeon]
MDKKKVKRELMSFQEIHHAEDYRNVAISVVLVQPEHAGNIGAIARIMKNFDFTKLVIFNPIETAKKILSYKTQGFAMHGKDVLMNSEIINIQDNEDYISKFKEFLKQYDLVIATTAKGKRYTNIRRLSIFPEDLHIPRSEKLLKIAILFGKESRGLTNSEITLADIILRIPTGIRYPSLNLSHACGIILYEIFKKINILDIGRGDKPVLLADREDRQFLLKIIKEISEKLKIRDYKKENVYYAFRNIFERAFMSKRELTLTTGLFSKVNDILKNLNLYKND